MAATPAITIAAAGHVPLLPITNTAATAGDWGGGGGGVDDDAEDEEGGVAELTAGAILSFAPSPSSPSLQSTHRASSSSSSTEKGGGGGQDSMATSVSSGSARGAGVATITASFTAESEEVTERRKIKLCYLSMSAPFIFFLLLRHITPSSSTTSSPLLLSPRTTFIICMAIARLQCLAVNRGV
jgi:hypothetical protein